jgi:hypothetical protein
VAHWNVHGNGFFEAEVEPCINGQIAAVGAYFGQDIRGMVDRLLSEQLSDGGWNCEAPERSTRSSFNTRICVLEALLEYERAGGGTRQVTRPVLRGQEYLLDRRLFRRQSTGEVIERDRKGGATWTHFAFPTWWHYDVLRRHARGTGGRSHRAGRIEARRRRTVAARDPLSRRDADRDG